MLTGRAEHGDSSAGERSSPTGEPVAPNPGAQAAPPGHPSPVRVAVLRWVLLTAATAVLVAGAAMTITRSHAKAPTTPGEEIIATVDGAPVYGVDLGPHVRPQAPWVGVNPPGDPVESALRDAVIVRLLTAEARRQGLVADTAGARSVVDAQLNLALIETELAARGIKPEAITAAEARGFYDDNLDRLSQFWAGSVAAIIVTDAREAQGLLAQAAGATDQQFADLVARHSTDAASKAKSGLVADVDAAADNLPLAVARVVVSTRRDGDVGFADTLDGRFWVVRVTKIKLRTPPWNPATEQRVRQIMLSERRGAVIKDLEARLRPAANVHIDRAALDRYRAEVATDLVPSVRTTSIR